ncbi:MAG TPA: Ig-like domain-containing protein [Vicinamibacterales bacterium]|nr:Ig-like domain-containing protein [Vicinamibacterales bacterium]
MRRALLFASGALLVAVTAAAQPAARTATTMEALTRYPLFFHGRHVVVRGTVSRPAPDVVSIRAGATDKPVFLLSRGETLPEEGGVEIRGEFWDLGRLTADDPRLARMAVDALLARATDGRWPSQNEVLVIVVQAVSEPERLPPGLRAIALEPDRYEGQTLTVVGRFRGANLYGDVPQPPGKSRFDFVIQSADAAVWVTGQRPRGKGFAFDATTRLDTGRSLEVTGTVRAENGLVWIEAKSLALASTPAPAAIVDAPARTQGPPPKVAFSLPIADETDVPPAIKVRVQFTRDMAPASFADRVRVAYVNANAAGPPPAFTVDYRRDNRVLEVTFAAPLARFSSVKVDLLEGITATDGAPLAPWSMTFAVGGGE